MTDTSKRVLFFLDSITNARHCLTTLQLAVNIINGIPHFAKLSSVLMGFQLHYIKTGRFVKQRCMCYFDAPFPTVGPDRWRPCWAMMIAPRRRDGQIAFPFQREEALRSDSTYIPCSVTAFYRPLQNHSGLEGKEQERHRGVKLRINFMLRV